MKKIIGVLVATLLVAGVFAGCASNKNGSATYGAAQAEADGRPRWAQQQVTFTSEEAPSYFNNGHESYIPVADGLFAAGVGRRPDRRSAEITSRNEARSALATFVQITLGNYTAENSMSVESVTVTKVNSLLVGSRIVDTWYDERDGAMYTLMFISMKDLEKSGAGDPELSRLIQSLLADRTKALSTAEAEAQSANR